MKKLILLVLLFVTMPLRAQHVQGGGHNYAPDADWQNYASSYSWSFPSPLNSQGTGCTIIVVIREPNWTVTDSQGNVFIKLETQSPFLWYSQTCSSGPDTLFIANKNVGQLDWVEFAIAEYAGVWVPKTLSAPLANQCCSMNASSASIAADPGDLLLGIGSNNTTDNPVITAGAGWTLRANYNAFLEDSVATVSGPVTSSVTYSSSVTWCQSIISFKTLASPPPLQIAFPGCCTVTFPIASASQVPTCAPADGSCTIQIQICDTAAPPNCLTSSTGTLSLVKTFSLPTPQVVIVPVAVASP